MPPHRQPAGKYGPSNGGLQYFFTKKGIFAEKYGPAAEKSGLRIEVRPERMLSFLRNSAGFAGTSRH